MDTCWVATSATGLVELLIKSGKVNAPASSELWDEKSCGSREMSQEDGLEEVNECNSGVEVDLHIHNYQRLKSLYINDHSLPKASPRCYLSCVGKGSAPEGLPHYWVKGLLLSKSRRAVLHGNDQNSVKRQLPSPSCV